jgi:hypothetical protein
METRDLWEDQVERLTRVAQQLSQKVEFLECRVEYYEKVLGTLLIALKSGGYIVDDPEGEYSMPS